MKGDFEDFLNGKFGEQYKGFDDDWPNEFDMWLGCLDIQEWIDYAEEWKKL